MGKDLPRRQGNTVAKSLGFGLTHLSAFGGAGNGGMDLVNSFLVWRLECESCHIEHI